MSDNKTSISLSPFPPDYRASGVLLHVTSLPSAYGIGDVGPTARAWVDWLQGAGQSWWQALPLGPTGYGNSPYQALWQYLKRPGGKSDEAAAALLGLAWSSVAALAITPLQDLGNLGGEARMNVPGRADGLRGLRGPPRTPTGVQKEVAALCRRRGRPPERRPPTRGGGRGGRERQETQRAASRLPGRR